MINVFVLEDEDLVQPMDLCRPLLLESMSGGHSDSYAFKSNYSQTPINNVKWTYVYQVFGVVHFNKSVKSINDGMKLIHEFIRGKLPEHHLYGKTVQELRFEYHTQYLSTPMKVGKYKGKSLGNIELMNPDYFAWACSAGLIVPIDTYIENGGL